MSHEAFRERFHVERRVVQGLTRAEDCWVQETLAGARSITGARRQLREVRRQFGIYFRRDDFRVVKVTTTRKTVTL